MTLLLLLGCATTMETDDLCKEVGYAIAGRTQDCTADTELAESRYLAFEEAYTCVEVDPNDTAGVGGVAPEDLFHCPLAIRSLACELVQAYGDDLDAWLGTSATCLLLVDDA